MGIALGDLGIAMTENLLDFIKGPAGIDKKTGVLMPEVVNTKMRQPGLLPEPGPYPHDRCVGLAGADLLAGLLADASVDKQVLKLAFGFQLPQNFQGTSANGHVRDRPSDPRTPNLQIQVSVALCPKSGRLTGLVQLE